MHQHASTPISGCFFETFRRLCGLVINTDAVHPADVGRHTGEDGGFPVGVAAGGGHKAGHTMDNPPTIDAAVQRATRVTLGTTMTRRAQSQKSITF